MLTKAACVPVLALFLATAALAAQKQRPDFNGQWVVDEKRTQQAAREQEGRMASGGDAPLGDVPVRAERLELKVDDTAITITALRRQTTTTTTITLDGVDRDGTSEARTTAKWRGRAIEVRLRLKGPRPLRTEFSMDGSWLVVKESQHDRDAGEKTAWRTRWTYYTKR